LGEHLPKDRKFTQAEQKKCRLKNFSKNIFKGSKNMLTAWDAFKTYLCGRPALEIFHYAEAPKKIFFKKLLTIFAAVIRSSSRWHHCQAEMISSESPKTSVTKLK